MIEIYTDGACTDNGKPCAVGAWAFVVVIDGKQVCSRVSVLAEHHRPHTNNKAELEGVRQALEWIGGMFLAGEPRHPFRVISDSRYVVDGMNSWTKAWRKRGWKGKKRAEIKNLSMWQELRDLADNVPAIFQWVRGHNGNRWNEVADELAESATKGKLKIPLDSFPVPL